MEQSGTRRKAPTPPPHTQTNRSNEGKTQPRRIRRRQAKKRKNSKRRRPARLRISRAHRRGMRRRVEWGFQAGNSIWKGEMWDWNVAIRKGTNESTHERKESADDPWRHDSSPGPLRQWKNLVLLSGTITVSVIT